MKGGLPRILIFFISKICWIEHFHLPDEKLKKHEDRSSRVFPETGLSLYMRCIGAEFF